MSSKAMSAADAANNKFSVNTPQLFSVKERLDNTLNILPPAAQANHQKHLQRSAEQFVEDYLQLFEPNSPNLVNSGNTLSRKEKLQFLNAGGSFMNDDNSEIDRMRFPVCFTNDIPLSKIKIDGTVQRTLDLSWGRNIVANFNPVQFQPIQVYKTEDDGYAAWDGQHSVVAWYIIAVLILKMDINDVLVPANIYDLNQRASIRQVFISMNTVSGKSKGKLPLDAIDIAEQQIFGVEHDNATDPEWKDMHAKWKLLKKHGLFLTTDQRDNSKQSGSLTRVKEIMNYDIEIIERFCWYANYVVKHANSLGHERPIDTKEFPVICEWIKLCKEQKDVWNNGRHSVTQEYMEDLAQYCIATFDADWTSDGLFWQTEYEARSADYNRKWSNAGVAPEAWPPAPKANKTVPQGLNFFWYQLTDTIHGWKPINNAKMPIQPSSNMILYSDDLIESIQ